ncbi:MAG: FAD-dependent oxidoreductase, partial [Clostridia bacterium]|nr:FAD-dependent oxidoreductase [Clostridia bacterium]
MNEAITVIGGGFAGVEAAWAAANRGCRVTLVEMKGVRFSPAHRNENLCELVCSNSFKAARLASAAGL